MNGCKLFTPELQAAAPLASVLFGFISVLLNFLAATINHTPFLFFLEVLQVSPFLFGFKDPVLAPAFVGRLHLTDPPLLPYTTMYSVQTVL